MSLEYLIEWKGSSRAGVTAYESFMLTTEGKMLFALIERWGMVAAKPDGYDLAGRQQLKVLEPDELVQRAREIVHAAMEVCREDGWAPVTPSRQALYPDEEEG